ncbi:uncharacterized protein LOC124499101 isoform X1 [Dermatophagoides farinae]|uniref:uncharacterized protein LOC124499101 isoform X1 n=1 Tax=Dermatophagoides farinae TaxID=6954 RepID=UPI003F647C0A
MERFSIIQSSIKLLIIFITFSSSIVAINGDKSVHNNNNNNNNKNDLKTQESFDSFTTGALGPLLHDNHHHHHHHHDDQHLDNHNNNDYGIPSSYDDLYKYGGIVSSGGGGGSNDKNILGHYGDGGGGGGYKNYYGDTEHLDQGLNKYNGHHKRDKYGGKSGNHKDYNDHHVYTRNRGYGYEKHYMYDKEYSTGKSTGTKQGHHSYYGDHDHGSKSTIDLHKNYDSKKFGKSIVDEPHVDDSNYDQYSSSGAHGHGHGHHGLGSLDHLNKMNLLNHKKELLRKHLDHEHHHHHGHNHHPPSIHQTYSKLHDYIPTANIVEHHHHHGVGSGGGGVNSYSHLTTPFLGTTYGSLLSPNSHQSYDHSMDYIPQHQYATSYFDSDSSNHPDDLGLYLSSSSNSNVKKLKNNNSTTNALINTDTEGESINTLLPNDSSGNDGDGSRSTSSSLMIMRNNNGKIINMAPLISTRLSSSTSMEPIEMMMIKSPQSPRGVTVAESFARIQNAVHATPPVIATSHLYQPTIKL